MNAFDKAHRMAIVLEKKMRFDGMQEYIDELEHALYEVSHCNKTTCADCLKMIAGVKRRRNESGLITEEQSMATKAKKTTKKKSAGKKPAKAKGKAKKK